jgi:hypothetical protein
LCGFYSIDDAMPQLDKRGAHTRSYGHRCITITKQKWHCCVSTKNKNLRSFDYIDSYFHQFTSKYWSLDSRKRPESFAMVHGVCVLGGVGVSLSHFVSKKMLASAHLVSREVNGFQILKNQIPLYGAQAELASVL